MAKWDHTGLDLGCLQPRDEIEEQVCPPNPHQAQGLCTSKSPRALPECGLCSVLPSRSCFLPEVLSTICSHPDRGCGQGQSCPLLCLYQAPFSVCLSHTQTHLYFRGIPLLVASKGNRIPTRDLGSLTRLLSVSWGNLWVECEKCHRWPSHAQESVWCLEDTFSCSISPPPRQGDSSELQMWETFPPTFAPGPAQKPSNLLHTYSHVHRS